MRYLLAALIVLGLSGLAYAAPVGLTSEADATKAELWADENYGLSIGLIGDFVDERGIDVDGGEFSIDAVIGRIGLSIYDRFNLYLDLGQAKDMEYTAELNSQKVVVKYEFDDELLWGIGVNALILRWDNGFEIGGGASYRAAEMTLDKVTIDNIAYTRANMDTLSDGDFEEWQVALECAWRLDFLTPYIGVKYSDVEVDGDVTYATVRYDASGKNSQAKVGGFAGLTITPKIDGVPKSEQIAINIEARFIDESAFNAGITYKF
ncbi:MAG: hypothetical protein KJ952_06345 [Candidatus Omnitrophica bacterium]|nr:hypothetical protein [Candidatus Omnitrophota bacterium]